MKPSIGIEVRGRVQELKHAEKKSLRRLAAIDTSE